MRVGRIFLLEAKLGSQNLYTVMKHRGRICSERTFYSRIFSCCLSRKAVTIELKSMPSWNTIIQITNGLIFQKNVKFTEWVNNLRFRSVDGENCRGNSEILRDLYKIVKITRQERELQETWDILEVRCLKRLESQLGGV